MVTVCFLLFSRRAVRGADTMSSGEIWSKASRNHFQFTLLGRVFTTHHHLVM